MDIGGAERIVYQLATDLKDEFDQVHVASTGGCGKKNFAVSQKASAITPVPGGVGPHDPCHAAGEHTDRLPPAERPVMQLGMDRIKRILEE